MNEQSPRFVYRILAFHVLLLVLALGLVAVASISIYRSMRDDALSQAQSHQELLAQDTCRGIQTYFAGMMRDLAWIQGRQESTTQPLARMPNPAPTQNLEGPNPLAATIIADQLGDSVFALFVYNKTTNVVTPYLPAQSKLNEQQLSTQMLQWLRSVNEPSASRLMKLEDQKVVLVAAPFSTVIRSRRLLQPGQRIPQSGRIGVFQRGTTRPAFVRVAVQPRLLVAAVPATGIEADFLPMLPDRSAGSATLADGGLQVIATSSDALRGMNLADFDNADLDAMLSDFQAHRIVETRIFTRPLSIYGQSIGPQMVTLAPVSIGQDKWTLFFTDAVANLDATVNQLFKRAVFWAGFVAASITAILVSTALQMIRWRARLERIRHEMLKSELTQARRIQEKWLPQNSAIPGHLDVAAINHPASHISGDFYNWFDLPDGRHAVVIGDVTGHGMAAAFLMATTQLLVRYTLTRLGNAGAAMDEVNQQLTSQMFHGQFVTMLIMTLDLQRQQLEVASAGHPPALIGSDGIFRPLAIEAQLVLGVEKQVVYPTQRFALPAGSSLLLYTDGMIDARNSDGDRFGKQRLLAALAGQRGAAAETVQVVAKAVQVFQGGCELDDDLTLVAIHLPPVAAKPALPKPASLTLPARS